MNGGGYHGLRTVLLLERISQVILDVLLGLLPFLQRIKGYDASGSPLARSLDYHPKGLVAETAFYDSRQHLCLFVPLFGNLFLCEWSASRSTPILACH